MRLAAKSPVAIDRRHETDPLIERRDAANFLELTFEDKNVRQVDCFTQGYGRDVDIDKAERVEVAALRMLAKFLDASGYSNLGSFQEAKVVSATDYGGAQTTGDFATVCSIGGRGCG